MEEDIQVVEIEERNVPTCPECGAELSVSGRCATCYECGFSLCSL